jgi:hypothetical protein
MGVRGRSPPLKNKSGRVHYKMAKSTNEKN